MTARGRPSRLSKLSIADQAKLLELLRRGVPKRWACRVIGMSPVTLENYRRRATAGEEPFKSFILDADQAQAHWVCSRLQVLNEDAIGAALTGGRERGDGSLKWLLERMFPKDFGPRRRIEQAGAGGAPLEPQPARLVIAAIQEAQ